MANLLDAVRRGAESEATMTRHWFACLAIGGALAIGPIANIGRAQPVMLESAQMGNAGRIGGTSITNSQFVGWRFETDLPLEIERVGGHLLSFPDVQGDIFAALVRLPSVESVPLGAPFTTEEVIATTTFRPPFPSSEVFTPFSATIPPGAYVLVYGAGLFGATGGGGAHNGPDQPDIPPTNLSSFIFWSIPFPMAPPEWRLNLASHMRFVIEAHVLRIAGDYNLDGVVGAEDYNVWKADFGATGMQDADGNNDLVVDEADYTVWRDNLGASVGSGGTASATPEPAAATMLVLGLALVAAAASSSASSFPHAWLLVRASSGRQVLRATPRPET